VRLVLAGMLPRQHDPEQIHGQADVLQLSGAEFLKPRLERIADLPFHIHRDANAARARQRLDAGSDVHSVAVNVAFAMHDITDVNPDLKFDSAVGADIMIPLGQRPLNFDRALRRFECASKLYEESVADGFNFGAVKARKNLAQQASMFFQQLERELIVALRQRAVAHHVGKHDGRELALLTRIRGHARIKSDRVPNAWQIYARRHASTLT
jgi:hypothetical protein